MEIPKILYSFIGDEAFRLHEHLLRPNGRTHLTLMKNIFSYRLSKVRRYIECAFGVLSKKWCIFHRPINVDHIFAVDIIKACVVFHNFDRDRNGLWLRILQQ
jgi:hypothetical protein